MTLNDFTQACETLAERGFTVVKAEYDSDSFGSWTIQFSSTNFPRHLLIWDGRDEWLILQSQRPKDERRISVTPEELQGMTYGEGVIAYARSESAAWQDKWIGRDEADHSLDRALEHFRS